MSHTSSINGVQHGRQKTKQTKPECISKLIIQKRKEFQLVTVLKSLPIPLKHCDVCEV